MSRLRASRLPVPAGTTPTDTPGAGQLGADRADGAVAAADQHQVGAGDRGLVRHRVAGVLDGGLVPGRRGPARTRRRSAPPSPGTRSTSSTLIGLRITASCRVVGTRGAERLLGLGARAPGRRTPSRRSTQHGADARSPRPRRRGCARRGRSGPARPAARARRRRRSRVRRRPRRRTSRLASTMITPAARRDAGGVAGGEGVAGQRGDRVRPDRALALQHALGEERRQRRRQHHPDRPERRPDLLAPGQDAGRDEGVDGHRQGREDHRDHQEEVLRRRVPEGPALRAALEPVVETVERRAGRPCRAR